MQALPGSAFKVIETEFFFQLLMSLLANPSCLDGCRQGAQVGLRRQVGEIVFFLPRRTVFADEPSLFPGEMLLPLVPDPLRWSVGTRTRTAAKRALSFPLVPVRQLMVCHLAWASMSSAGIDRTSGTCR